MLGKIFDSELDPDNATNQFLTFILGSEEYGVDILQVQEIKGWGEVTRIPNMPDYILGVINLRGTIVPIMDLRKRFQLPEANYDAMTVVIVVKVRGKDQDRIVGLVVDAVSEVYDLSDQSMAPTPDFGCNIDIDFIDGIANIEDKLIILMNVDKLVSHDIREHLAEAKSRADDASDRSEAS
jgi:purine-binding chemotaxis protein CheW